MREPGIAGFADDEMFHELIPTVPRGTVVDVVVLVVDVVELVVVVADGTVVTSGAMVVDVVELVDEVVEEVEVVDVVVVTVVSYTMVSSADPGAVSVLLDESVARVNT